MPTQRTTAYEVIFRATREVGGAVLTAVLTTVVGFLPGLRHARGRGQTFHSAGLY